MVPAKNLQNESIDWEVDMSHPPPLPALHSIVGGGGEAEPLVRVQ